MKHVNVKPFTDELTELQDYLQRHWFVRINEQEGLQFNALMEALAKVNNDLWKIEDEVRIRMKKFSLEGKDHKDTERLAEIALLVPELNDKRGDLVQEINRMFGVAEQEKIYVAK